MQLVSSLLFARAQVLLSYTHFITPVNFANMHWGVVVVNVRSRTIRLFDPMPSQSRHGPIREFFQEFFSQRALAEANQGHDVSEAAKHAEQWSFSANSDNDASPRQADGHSCGIISCKIIEALLAGKDVSWKAVGMKAPLLSEEEAYQYRVKLHGVIRECAAEHAEAKNAEAHDPV